MAEREQDVLGHTFVPDYDEITTWGAYSDSCRFLARPGQTNPFCGRSRAAHIRAEREQDGEPVDWTSCECGHSRHDHPKAGACSLHCACEAFDRRVDAVVVNHRTGEVTDLAWRSPSAEREQDEASALEPKARAMGFDGQHHPEDCTPETCPCFRAGLESCVSHRCRKHYGIPAQNKTEAGGSECGGCIAAERDAALRRAEEAEGRIENSDEARHVAAHTGETAPPELSCILCRQEIRVTEEHQRAERALDLLMEVRASALNRLSPEQCATFTEREEYFWGEAEALLREAGRLPK